MRLSLTILLDEIPEPGFSIEGELPAEWLAPSLLAAYTASSPVQVALTVKQLNANVYVEGLMRTTLSFQDSRTLEPGSLSLSLVVSELFQPAAATSINLCEGVDASDLGDELRLYEGKKIELEDTLRELLVLAQDPYPSNDDASDGDKSAPLWTSRADPVDPRWATLQNIKIN